MRSRARTSSGYCVAHQAHDFERDLVEERLRDSEAMAVTNRAAHDAAKDVLAAGAIGHTPSAMRNAVVRA